MQEHKKWEKWDSHSSYIPNQTPLEIFNKYSQFKNQKQEAHPGKLAALPIQHDKGREKKGRETFRTTLVNVVMFIQF